MDRRFDYQDADGRRVSAVLLTPDTRTDQVVVLCHGFMGFKDSWTNRALSEQLALHGIATFRFDFFGHGQSAGDLKELLLTTLLAQTQGAVALMRGHGFTRVGLLGSSFGGLVATLVAARDPALSALGLRCPLGDFPALLRQRFGRVALELWRRLGHVPEAAGHIPVHYRFYEDCLRHDVYRAARNLRVPTVIVHGDRDEVIPVSQARALFAEIQAHKQLHVLPGADHRFSNPSHFADMTALLVGWLRRYLSAPAPSAI